MANGFVSVTPLQIDLTHYGQLDAVRGWLALDGGSQQSLLTRRPPAASRRLRSARAVSMSSRHTGIGMTSQRTRMRMVERLREQGIRDEVVLAALSEVPRHIFVDEALAHPRLRRYRSADRLRPDDLAALGGRAHD